MRRPSLGVLIFCLGGMLTLGYAPFFWWPLGIAALAGLIWFIRHAESPKQAAGAGFVFGLGHYLTSLYWIPRSFYIDAGGHWGPALWGGVPALLAMVALLAGFLAVLSALARLAPAGWRSGTFILLWLLLELAKNLPPLHFPWNPLGAIFAESVPLMQLASIGSTFLLSTMVLLIAATLSFVWRGWIVAGLLLAGQAGFGYYRIIEAPELPPLTTIRLVQANIESAHKWDDAKRRAYLHRHVDMMVTDDPAVTHIFWPETAVAYAVEQDPGLRAMLGRNLQPQQTLTLGFLRFDENADGLVSHAYNSAATLYPDGSLGPIYDKHILVPFGETLPFADFTQRFLRTLSFNRGIYTPGTHPPFLPLGDGLTALPLICYEAAFPLYVAEHLENQQVLLNLTNDNWFDGTTAPHQHFAMARLRAVETGLSLIRAANTGHSAIVDGYGRIVADLPMRQQKAANFSVPEPAPRTIFIKIYNYFN